MSDDQGSQRYAQVGFCHPEALRRLWWMYGDVRHHQVSGV